ncbi:MAG: DNA polymerase III subunit gamma/tau [Pseudomonadota bacterium]
MTYQALARKLRPADFAGLVGQDHVVQALTHALDHDRLHHAYLFTGTRGVGKTTVARILAKCLNCERGVSSSPCGVCDACVMIGEGRFVDLIEMDAASQRGVESIHDLQDNAQYMPNSGRFKVYLIDEVHMLSTHAFNALLKTLEEPPEHVKFLLATTEAKKVPVTILSRCLQFQLKNMTPERITAYLAEALQAESVPYETGALEIIAGAARGSMRDALSVTDQAISFGAGKLTEADVASLLGVTGRDELRALLEGIASGEPTAVLACAAELAERGVDFQAVLADLVTALHDIAVAQALPDSADVPLGRDFAPRFDGEAVQLNYQIALRGHRDLAYAPEPRIGFEMTLLRMLQFALPPPQDAPRQRQTDAEDTAADNSGARAGVAPDAKPASAHAAHKPAGADPTAAARPASDESQAAAHAPANGADPVADKRPERPSSAPSMPEPAREQAGAAARTEVAPVDPPRPPNPATRAVKARAPADGWYALLREHPSEGVLAMLLRNSVLLDKTVTEAGERWSLRLDAAHDALLGDRHPREMGAHLSRSLDRSISVDLEVGSPEWETPAQQDLREAEERQAAAIDEFTSHDDVRALLETFDARVDMSTIAPVENDSAGAA